MKKIFENKIVKIVAWGLLGVSSTSLILGGATTESLESGIVLVSGIVSAVSGLIAFITKQVSNDKKGE